MFSTDAKVIEYDSKKLSDVRGFCISNHLSIMVMNKQVFDMDKPQEGMDTKNRQKHLAAFNPLFKLRYSETHRQPKNIIYRLSPYDASNMGLVKKISVLSIHETNTQSNVAITFKKINLSAKEPTATVQLNVRMAGGDFKTKRLNLKCGNDLEEKTNNPIYHGWTVEDIGTTSPL